MKKSQHSNGSGAGHSPKELYIVGLGASAGGIQALKEFFEQVSEKSGLAYVVILHLSPDHDSKLAEVLQVVSKIPVQQVTEKVQVKPDHIYVVPPNQHLMMEDGEIVVSPNLRIEDRRAPVDIFFRTLSVSHGPRAVCVVLSGTGANGSMGLKHIKERGGAAFVQNPREAEFNEMPRNSIATELVDEVLPVAAIPGKIMAYVDTMGKLQIPTDATERAEIQQSALRELFTQLRVSTGHDFSNYKRPTLLRRIERRINIRLLPDLPSYAAFIREHPEEAAALLKDILISVTNFFRDQKAFEVIEQDLLPRMLKGRTAEDQLRIWVAGCATGEEAYSLAMLCAERTFGVIDAPKIQIFATDIDEAAIAHAREGLYTINDAADVSPERLRRFFNKEGEVYRVRREVREMILFAHHNFIKDPPFSRLDMLSCRNVLIYLNHVAQQRVIETFHFALKPGRYLFLGSAESVDGATDLYAYFNKQFHIFQTRQVSARSYPVPEAVPVFHIHPPKPFNITQEAGHRAMDRITFGDLHQRLLEQYAPPSVVVNEEYEIVRISERAGRFMQISGGELSQNLLKLVRQELRLELRSALYQAMQKRSAVAVNGLKIKTEDNSIERINLHVKPVLRQDDIARGYILVIFEPAAGDVNEEIIISSDEPIARHLEEQLVRIKTQLRNATEQHEFQAEELKASNEELQAMNEELRSAAEELETSKEELQSINEELSTVNQELKGKIEETRLSGNNLQNLINSVDIGTIFLDRSLKVMLFTPAARNIFNLIPSDTGRRLSDITNSLEYGGLLEDTELVLEKLHIIEREARTTNGNTFIVRILPYRTAEDRINGVVITFVDITKRKLAEEDLRSSEERFRTLNDAVPQLIWANDSNGKANYFNQRWFEYSGLDYKNSAGLGWEAIVHPEDAVASVERWHTNLKERKIFDAEFRLKRADGNYRWHIARNVPMHATDGTVSGWFGSATDIEDLKTAERSMEESRKRLQVTLESAIDFAIITLDTQGIIENWNKGASNLLGYSEREAIGQPGSIIFTDEDQQQGIPEKELKTAAKKGRALDERWHRRKDDSRIFMSGVLTPIYSGSLLTGFVKVARDITTQKQAEQALVALEERYRIALKSAEMGTWDWKIEEDKIDWNEQHYFLLGLQPDNKPVHLGYFMQFVHPEDAERVKKILLKAVKEISVYHAEFRIIRANKKDVRWISGYGRAIAPENESATRMVGVMYDITDRKKLEKEKEEFINIASHEIKTPLTSIKAYAEILEDLFEQDSSAQHVQYMQKMNTQIDRLNNLVTDLLDTTKVAEGQLPLQLQVFDLNELIEERVNDLKHISHIHQLLVSAGKIPAVTADRERIGQVLTNLINNAIKYSPNGGDIDISSSIDKKGVKVSVRDRGIGIPEEMHDKVFDRFFRVINAVTNNAPGMGLGLYISAGIINRHGGTISVESNPAQGTAFSFILPFSGIKTETK